MNDQQPAPSGTQPPPGSPPSWQPPSGSQYQPQQQYQPQWQTGQPSYPPQQFPGGPYGSPPPQRWQSPQPRKSWPARHKVLTVLSIVGVLLILVVVVAVSNSPNTTKVSTPPASPAAKSSPTPAAPLSGPVGTTYRVTDDNGNVMTVTLTKLIDPAQGTDQFTTPNNGFRFVGAVFRLKGVSGTFNDDANNDATVIGANGQSYTADFNSIAEYTNFNDGQFNLTPGQRSVGAVTFQVPVGIKVTSVQWSGTGGFGGSSATWTLP